MAIITENSSIIQAGDIAGDLAVIEVWSTSQGLAYYSVVRYPDGLRMHYNHEELMAVAKGEKE